MLNVVTLGRARVLLQINANTRLFIIEDIARLRNISDFCFGLNQIISFSCQNLELTENQCVSNIWK